MGPALRLVRARDGARRGDVRGHQGKIRVLKIEQGRLSIEK
jgi:hypothetical protein